MKPKTTDDRRLIEDYLPIKAISAEASREKSVRKGHISTLHLWWARRPLVACRAAVYGALVPADQFQPKNGPPEKRKSLGRANAANFIERLCKYPGNPQVIKEAQKHILEAHAERLTKETGKKVTREDIEEGHAPRPKVLDMFAGGGAISKECPAEEMEVANRIQEESLVCFQAEIQKPLVTELWAIRGKTNEVRVKKIADRSRLPLIWLEKIPGTNGETGTEKLRAERSVLLLRDRISPFIEQFQHPIGRCAKFYKLTAYNNCNFWCEYCYLYLTFRTQPVSTHFINYEKMYDEIEKFDRSRIPKSLRVLNLGELGDPLAVDYITGFAREVIPFMPEHAPRTRLLFLTKSDCVDEILGLDHGGQSIVTFSVNTDTVFQQLEHRTPSPESRLTAAAKVRKAGYEVRLRIDPVIYYSTWEKDYISLVDKIFQFVQPTRITIGEYRPSNGLANHITSRFPDSPLLRINKSLVKEGAKLRYPKAQRIKIFKTVIEAIRKHGSDVDIALCKEQSQIWKALGLDMKGLLCNCLS